VKRAVLRYIAASVSGATLSAKLATYQTARVDEPSRGRFITSVSGNGHSTQFSNVGGLNQTELLDLSEELIQRYEAALVDLGGTPTDSAVLAEMLAMLKPVGELYTTFAEVTR
jgi:hypothetical protein